MNVLKNTIQGKKGKTVIYSPQFEYLENTISWGDFRFYTPVGAAVDLEGYHYFNVPAGQIEITREDLTKTLLVMITQERGVEVIEIYEGAEADMEEIKIDLEGDIVIYGRIPADPVEEIQIQFKEVLNV